MTGSASIVPMQDTKGKPFALQHRNGTEATACLDWQKNPNILLWFHSTNSNPWNPGCYYRNKFLGWVNRLFSLDISSTKSHSRMLQYGASAHLQSQQEIFLKHSSDFRRFSSLNPRRFWIAISGFIWELPKFTQLPFQSLISMVHLHVAGLNLTLIAQDFFFFLSPCFSLLLKVYSLQLGLAPFLQQFCPQPVSSFCTLTLHSPAFRIICFTTQKVLACLHGRIPGRRNRGTMIW